MDAADARILADLVADETAPEPERIAAAVALRGFPDELRLPAEHRVVIALGAGAANVRLGYLDRQGRPLGLVNGKKAGGVGGK